MLSFIKPYTWEKFMKTNRPFFAKILSILVLISLVSGIFVFHGVQAVGADVIYVSPTGSDSAKGTREAPLATLDAAFVKLDGGGTIVITGALSADKTVLNAAVTQKCAATKPIVITGRDPFDGSLYKNATLPYNSPRLYGEMKFEHLILAPTRNYAFFNTYGNRLIFGEGLKITNFDAYVHGGSFGNTTAKSSYIELCWGRLSTVYMGGAFATNTSNGVYGDTKFVINGGSVTNLCIGFDTSSSNHTEGTINGNVIIRHNGGLINKIYSKSLVDNKVCGYIAIISKGGLSADITSIPNAQDGTYIVNVSGKGEVNETETAGVFEIIPESGYMAYVNGKLVTENKTALPEGESTVKFLKDTVPVSYEGGLVDAKGEEFAPNELATRLDVANAAARCLENAKVSYDYAALCALISSNGALPLGWEDGNGQEAVTKAEGIFILTGLFDAHADSTKLFDFSDVTDDHIYADAIKTAAGKGKIKGLMGDMFFPDKKMSRYELCEMLAFYLDRAAKSDAACPFSDVPQEMRSAVCAAASDRTQGLWDFEERKYILPDSKNTRDYIEALHSQAPRLSPDGIKEASDVIAEKMRENILLTPNTEKLYDFDALGIKTVYYVSEKYGDDSNNGLSQNSPFKTPAALVGKIKNNRNVAVLFERGGVYRIGTTGALNLSGSKNIVLGSYGSGPKPLVIQSRWNYANDNWTQVNPNVYRLETPLRNVGVIAFDHDMTDYSDGTYDELFGEIENIDTQGFTAIHNLTKDLQFYCELQPTHTETTTEETVNGQKIVTTVTTDSYDRFSEGYLYLYSEHGNPSDRFSSIEIGENYDLVDGAAHGCIIDNISFKYTGSHGIGLGVGEDLTVSNCIFSWLGGSVLWETETVTTTVTNETTGETKTTKTFEEATCYGNAVEVYGPCDGYYVKNNWIYQIFDDGITNQFHGETDCIQKDIVYTENLLEYVYHMFSNSKSNKDYYESTDFPTEGSGAPSSYTADLELSYNVCRMAGYGWGGPIKNRVHTGMMYRTYVADYNKDERVLYNLFDSNGGYTVFSASNAHDSYDGNIFIQIAGTKLRSKLKTGITTYDDKAHRNIKELFGDENAIVILDDPNEISDCRKVEDKLTFVGAQIRADSTHALRFLFSISRESFEKMSPDEIPKSSADTGAGFGAVIIPESFFDGTKLYKNTMSIYNGTPVRAGIVPAVRIYAQNEDEIIFTLCVTDILPQNYTRKFVAVPYLSYEDEGALKTVYGEQTSGISMYDIAQFAWRDPKNPESIRNSIYDSILSVVDPQKYPPR